MKSSGKITKIAAQKKSKNRLSIFLDDAFAFGLDVSVVAKFNLKKGDVLTQDEIANILLNEESKRIKENAFRYLAGRAHSEQELRTKLKQKGFEKALVEEVISELKQAKFIDDVEFAFSYARKRMMHKPMGEKLLRQELWQKGIDEKIIDRVVREIYSEKTQDEVALNLMEKRKSRYKDLDEKEQKKRLYNFLLRRGFDWEVVNEVMEKRRDN